MRHRIFLATVPLLAVAALSAPRDRTDPHIVRGEQVYGQWCATCHGAGLGNPGLAQKPGTAALQAKYEGKLPALLTERTDLTPEVVAYYVRYGITVMPFFRKTEISDADLVALGRYVARNTRKTR